MPQTSLSHTRWKHIASLPIYRALVPDIKAYLTSQIPAWLFPVLEAVLADIYSYFGDYGARVLGIGMYAYAPTPAKATL